ncbi:MULTISPECIES: tryptophan synthase subunit beta [unclassified Thioalkalivibrio]|uniref:tryptophan synthase subunit beta n=1 Tax=unclassified Thioalkalivibrio TaxID=2621013 RepID=UPI00037A9027|nr:MULTISPECIES: tryptophan synthase subunit beta [unclassified Thioalkalivibrio]
MSYLKDFPNAEGYFGDFGGAFLPPELESHFAEIERAWRQLALSADFLQELRYIRRHYQGRPTPVYYARNLSREAGAHIYLKREDLNHSGAHKLNHCMGEALLARHMGKKKLIAETGAGQHGVALATAAACFGMECEIHMGEIDIEKEAPNVTRMKLMGAEVVPVSFGGRSLKEAVDSAFQSYLSQADEALFAIGSVVGPHPFPLMVRNFQSVVGIEAREQYQELTDGQLPEQVVACVGGGSNAMGMFAGFIDDPEVQLNGVEPLGRGSEPGQHSATMTFGKPGMLHGFKCMLLTDNEGNPAPVHSIASGLDYPGVGPEHSYLKTTGRVAYHAIGDDETLDAFYRLSRTEGIIPALESAHAVAWAVEHAREHPGSTVLVNLSGRGDKDIDYVARTFGHGRAE